MSKTKQNESEEDLAEKNRILTALGNTIREQRENRELSQTDLSIKTGVDRNTISNLENGKSNIRFYTLFKLLEPLRIPTDALFYPDSKSERPAIQELIVEISDLSDREIKMLTRMIVMQKKTKGTLDSSSGTSI